MYLILKTIITKLETKQSQRAHEPEDLSAIRAGVEADGVSAMLVPHHVLDVRDVPPVVDPELGIRAEFERRVRLGGCSQLLTTVLYTPGSSRLGRLSAQKFGPQNY